MNRTKLHERRLRPTAAPPRLSGSFLWFLAIFLLRVPWLDAQSTCGNTAVTLTPDYQFALGTSSGGGAYTWTLNGQTVAQGGIPQLGLFHYDNSLASTSGTAPTRSAGASFVPGKWGTALAVASGGGLSYPAAGNLSLKDGTIEMWIAPTSDGTAATYSQRTHTLLQYIAVNGDQLWVAEATNGGFFGSTVIGGKFIVAGGVPKLGAWKAGEWHHIAFTYSATQGRFRMYLDGAMTGENDAISMPAADGSSFTVDSDGFNGASAFLIDELRISSNEKSSTEIQYDISRTTPFSNNEVLLPLAGASAGQIGYSVTPEGSATACGSATAAYVGVPITNPSPPSTLLPSGSTSFQLAVQTPVPTACGYSVNTARDYGSMTAFDTGQGQAAHATKVSGLSADPSIVNDIYVGCALAPAYLLHLQYRALPTLNNSYPHIANLQGLHNILANGVAAAARYDLLSDNVSIPASSLSQIRKLNSGATILYWVNAEEDWTGALPESYYLHDVSGHRIQDWPDLYLLNITNPLVGEYLANQFYQMILGSGLMYDGCFFDSFSVTQTNEFTNYLGQLVAVDADGDGKQDDQQALNTAWRAGMLQMMNQWRQLVPNGFAVGHLNDPTGDLASVFNGDSLIFLGTDVLEGRLPFSGLFNRYNEWFSLEGSGAMPIVESSPQSQISYGYGVYGDAADLPKNIPQAVLAFARDYYPSMRFPLAVSLMNDGYSLRDLGDMSTGYTNWWYDEYDFKLGLPVAPAVRIGSANAANLISNGGFESSLTGTWQLNVVNDGQGKATVALDTSIAADGNSSAQVTIASIGTVNWHTSFEQENLPIVAGTNYRVQFWARADSPRTITVFSQGGAPSSTYYGLSAQIAIDTTWRLYSAAFVSPVTANDARLEFWMGDVAGSVWFDDVQLAPASGDVYRRDFTNGIALLNGTATQQTISLEPGLQRFRGTQAPRHQYIVDDSSAASFTFSGPWTTVTIDSGVRIDDGPLNVGANPPFYHCWQSTCHELDGTTGTAQWTLSIPEDGQYTIQTWLPAAPNASSFTKNAIYEVVSGGNVIASATIDQTTAGVADGWHAIASVSLTAAAQPFVRIRNGGSGSLIADAVYVTSTALYNDGSAATQVTLAAFDGILLQRQQPVAVPTSRVSSVVNASSYQPAIASAGFVSIFGTGFANSARSWGSSDFSGGKLPVSLDGVSVTINGKAAYVEYISPTQINAIAPDDDTIGPVPVQVTTPQGASYSGTVLKQKLSPACFTYQSGASSYAAAVHVDGTLVGPNGPSSRPAAPGEVIEVYGTGFGATTAATPTAQLVSQPAPLALPVTMTIGGVAADVQWAGLVLSGLYQFNVKIPNLAAGDQQVQMAVSGFQTPAVMLSVTGQ